MKTGCRGHVLATPRVLASSSGWDAILVRSITWYARRVGNSGREFMLRECVGLQHVKSLFRAVCRSGAESSTAPAMILRFLHVVGNLSPVRSEICKWLHLAGFV